MPAKYNFDQFSATRIYYPVAAYSPDGTQIAHVNNATGQFNLWVVPSGGGFARQLTSYTDNTVRGVEWSKDGESLIIQADQNGDEFHQLYRLSAFGGYGEPLTTKMDSQHYVGTFSPDGKKLSYAANDRIETALEIVIRDMETGETQRPFPVSGGFWFPGDFSPDGRFVLGGDFVSNTDHNIYVLDMQSGEVFNATPHEGEAVFFPVSWSADSAGFYLLSDQGHEYNGLAYYILADRSWQYIETPDHDIEHIDAAKDGSRLVWVVNVDGASKLQGKDLRTGEPLPLPDLPLGQIDKLVLSPDGTRVAFVMAKPTEATNLYEVDLQTGDMIRLGQSMMGGIDPADLAEPELVHYPTFDGRMIPAWLYRPKGMEGAQVPVILSIHGGPEAQERPRYSYNGMYQYMLTRGFAILAPNIRGSTGYGKTYQRLIHRDWGGGELKDIEGAALYLRSQSWVDSNRIAVMGGSFGGFATLSAVTRLPDYWAVGVDFVGPSNLVTFIQSVPPTWRASVKAWVGDPDEDRDMLMERSPITYVHQLRVPLLVIQGAKDPRVVQAESDQMVERIKANGGDVRYYVDPVEGHGATRRENAIKWYKMMADYIQEYLLDEPVTQP